MIPVVLFVYRRPAHTQRVLSALRKNNIDLLYVFSDAGTGPKDNILVEKTRELINKIDWVEKIGFFHNEHKGLASSVIEGISNVLHSFDKVVVLEDDCIPAPGFYAYMRQCLLYYEKVEQVSCVSAFLHPLNKTVFEDYNYDVFFWKRFWSWGWGTWRRAWQNFDPDLKSLVEKAKKSGLDTSVFGRDVSLVKIEKEMGKIDSWAMPFFLSMVLNNTFSVYPVKSYIQNIGFDGSGTHCFSSNKYRVHPSDASAQDSLRFPEGIIEEGKIIREIVNFVNSGNRKSFLRRIKEDILRKQL